MSNQKLQQMLNQQVANLNLMYIKLHSYHWFVTGDLFFTLHEKFEELYNEITGKMDEVAERLLTIGGKPYATLKEYVLNATLPEACGNETAEEMVRQLINDFTQMNTEFGEALKEADRTGDNVSNDMLIGMQGDLEKHIWMLNAYLGNDTKSGQQMA
jgi:starvation-inducible DNA-binding protein